MTPKLEVPWRPRDLKGPQGRPEGSQGRSASMPNASKQNQRKINPNHPKSDVCRPRPCRRRRCRRRRERWYTVSLTSCLTACLCLPVRSSAPSQPMRHGGGDCPRHLDNKTLRWYMRKIVAATRVKSPLLSDQTSPVLYKNRQAYGNSTSVILWIPKDSENCPNPSHYRDSSNSIPLWSLFWLSLPVWSPFCLMFNQFGCIVAPCCFHVGTRLS